MSHSFCLTWFNYSDYSLLYEDTRANWMASSVAVSVSDTFLVGTRSFSEDCRRSRDKISSSCDDGRCQRVGTCLRKWRAAYGHVPWNGRRPLWKPIVTTRRTWLVRHLTVVCIVNAKRHRTYVVWYFRFFKTKNHSVWEDVWINGTIIISWRVLHWPLVVEEN